MIYLDTSAVVPYYVPENLSNIVERLLQQQEDQPIISQLVEVELFSALSRRVRMSELSRNDALAITELFKNHINEGLYINNPPLLKKIGNKTLFSLCSKSMTCSQSQFQIIKNLLKRRGIGIVSLYLRLRKLMLKDFVGNSRITQGSGAI